MRPVLTDNEIEGFRRRLCEAAERLFAERGVEGVSMRQIAERLNCSAMTPYRYFRNKDDIFAAVRAAALDRFSERLETARRSPGTPSRRGRAVGDAYLRFAIEEPDAYRLIFDLSQPEDSDYPDLVRANARARKTMTGYLEDLIAAGLMNGDPKTLGLIYWAGTHGLVTLFMAGKIDEAELRALHEQMARTLSHGAMREPASAQTTRAS
ncbi:MAG: TetR/AcrR family transcriptional regulator [Hyphomicrobiales bacterium]|nr:TetR/AcrR family transcriptional regulator [Hyphomicrobiales bacterium]